MRRRRPNCVGESVGAARREEERSLANRSPARFFFSNDTALRRIFLATSYADDMSTNGPNERSSVNSIGGVFFGRGGGGAESQKGCFVKQTAYGPIPPNWCLLRSPPSGM